MNINHNSWHTQRKLWADSGSLENTAKSLLLISDCSKFIDHFIAQIGYATLRQFLRLNCSLAMSLQRKQVPKALRHTRSI